MGGLVVFPAAAGLGEPSGRWRLEDAALQVEEGGRGGVLYGLMLYCIFPFDPIPYRGLRRSFGVKGLGDWDLTDESDNYFGGVLVGGWWFASHTLWRSLIVRFPIPLPPGGCDTPTDK